MASSLLEKSHFFWKTALSFGKEPFLWLFSVSYGSFPKEMALFHWTAIQGDKVFAK